MGIYQGYQQSSEHKKRKAAARRRGKFFVCEVCDLEFWRKPSEINKCITRFCSSVCYGKWQTGRPKASSPRPQMAGANNPRWKGGITPINGKIRTSYQYQEWRRKVFARDRYTCQHCGSKCGNGVNVTLNADHIKSFAEYPELRFDVNNGRTLCIDCHKATDSYGWKYFNARKS